MAIAVFGVAVPTLPVACTPVRVALPVPLAANEPTEPVADTPVSAIVVLGVAVPTLPVA